jgi:ATP-binding cassette subfamily F protein uup
MLEEALADFDGSVLVVSHDRYFLDRICDQIVTFEDGGLFVQPGNYSYYHREKKERDQRDQDRVGKPGGSSRTRAENGAAETKPASQANLQRTAELEEMEAAILTVETRVKGAGNYGA